MPDFTDVLIRVRAASSGGNGQPSVHDVEASVNGSGLWRGVSRFDLDSLDLNNPEEYGKALGRQLINPSMLRALDQAGLTRSGNIRLRLWLEDDPSVPHWIRWERIWLSAAGASWRLAVHPRIAMSRYISVENPDEEPPDSDAFRLLFAVANPAGLKANQVIDVEAEIASLLSEFEARSDRRLQLDLLPGRTVISQELQARAARQGWTVIAGPATLANLSDQMHKRYHGLHILAHGEFDPTEGVGSLLLESGTGGKAETKHTELQSVVTVDLQLMVFQACNSASPTAEGQSPFTSLAPRMVQLGVPAVIAMQDYVAMTDARIFFSEFYRGLIDEGFVDVAVNRGRQRLIQQPGSDNWSIPALFTRLKGGKLWSADPLRQAVLRALHDLPPASRDLCPPQQAIEHTRGISGYDPAEGARGPRFDLDSRSLERLKKPGSFAILTGPRGANKTVQLRRVFRQFAEAYEQSQPGTPVPILVVLPALAGRKESPWGPLQRIWRDQAREEDLRKVQGREFLFLVQGEEEATDVTSAEAADAIERLRRVLPDCRILLITDEYLLPAFQRFSDGILFVAQPLEWSRVGAFLEEQKTEEAASLRYLILERGLNDLAVQPRFLQHLLTLVARGKTLDYRSGVLADIAEIYLSRMETRRVPRACAVDALQRIAFAIQDSRNSDLAAGAVYEIFTAARGGRELSISDLKSALIDDCRILIPSGDESVRFAYLGMQWYFAACYLAKAPNRQRLIEDITASLGRLARVRRWEKVLVLLASMIPDPARYLKTVLLGSSFMEGEQLFLAVHCYQEACARYRDTSSELDVVADQVADALLWRSSWDPARPYGDRRKAVGALVELMTRQADRRTDLIAHLIGLACDKVPATGAKTDQEYDWSGIRQAAAFGLARVREQTRDYVEQNRKDLMEPLEAWFNLHKDPTAMYQLLLRDDPRVSVIAAVALAQSSRPEDRALLISGYEKCRGKDVLWGITDALGAVEAGWAQTHAVKPWMKQSWPSHSASEQQRAAHTCFLIQKTRLADEEARSYLADCLLNGQPFLQGRALRAFGKLEDAGIEAWLRPLCEAIVEKDAGKIDSSKMKLASDQVAFVPLQRAAIEALRDIGDGNSLDVLRSARTRYLNQPELTQLSFQVAEEIYWRLAGGIERESYSTGRSRN